MMTERHIRIECRVYDISGGACAALALAGLKNGQAWDMLFGVQHLSAVTREWFYHILSCYLPT